MVYHRKLYDADSEERRRLEAVLAEQLSGVSNIAFACLYGSFCDDTSAFGDIDLGVFYLEGTPEEMADQALSLAVSLTKAAAVPVDVRVLNHAPASFRFQTIKADRPVFIRWDNCFSTFFENTVREYLDIKPILEQAAREAFS